MIGLLHSFQSFNNEPKHYAVRLREMNSHSCTTKHYKFKFKGTDGLYDFALWYKFYPSAI